MSTPLSESALAYVAKLGELLLRREMPGGITDDEEETFACGLHDLRHGMTDDEADAISRTIAKLTGLKFQCAYCRHLLTTAAAFSEHVINCEKHPAREVVALKIRLAQADEERRQRYDQWDAEVKATVKHYTELLNAMQERLAALERANSPHWRLSKYDCVRTG